MLNRREFISVPLATAIGAGSAASVQGGRGSETLSAGGGLLVAGDYIVDRDLTVAADLTLLPGARIVVAAHRTLTLAGDFAAPAAFVFPGAGTVDLNRSKALVARPEWWGAVPGDAALDSLPALNACIAAHPATALVAGDYFTSDTLRVTLPNRLIEGLTGFSNGRTSISRIVLRSGAGDVMQVGPDSQPASQNAFLPGIRLRQLELARSEALTAGPDAGAGAPAGLRVQYATACQFDNLTSMEHGIGYALRGVVRSFFRNCSAYRSRPARTKGKGSFFGFYFDGTAELGLAGGNASIYAIECVASVARGLALERSAGAYLPSAFADLFLVRFETAAMGYGILVEGLGTAAAAPRRKWGNGDLHIVMPILDDVSRAGIKLSGLSPYAMVDIVDPYVSVGRQALAAISIDSSNGLITVTAGQLHGWDNAEAGGSAIGLELRDAAGVTAKGTKLLGFTRPVEAATVHDLDLDIAVHNPDQLASQAAIQLVSCDRGSVRARARGRASAFPAGVSLEGKANAHLSIDVTGIDPLCIAGGARNTLRLDGTPVAEPGYFGTNLATGVMG